MAHILGNFVYYLEDVATKQNIVNLNIVKVH